MSQMNFGVSQSEDATFFSTFKPYMAKMSNLQNYTFRPELMALMKPYVSKDEMQLIEEQNKFNQALVKQELEKTEGGDREARNNNLVKQEVKKSETGYWMAMNNNLVKQEVVQPEAADQMAKNLDVVKKEAMEAQVKTEVIDNGYGPSTSTLHTKGSLKRKITEEEVIIISIDDDDDDIEIIH